MKKHKPWLGFSLALLATLTWGSLPVIAQQALKAVNAPPLVWVRCLV
ncbi:EamA family transporter, partial [Neisseria sp. P0015.S009]